MKATKPAPHVTAETRPFWEACARGELLYQRCEACGKPQFYPRTRCARCHSDRLTWEHSARRGTIHSFTIVHRAPTEAFRADIPYVLVLVDLDEGFRMMMNVRECPPSDVVIGMRVGVIFERRDDGVVLPQAISENQFRADV